MALSNFITTLPVGQPVPIPTQPVAPTQPQQAVPQAGIHGATGGLNYQFSPLQSFNTNYAQTGAEMVQGNLESMLNPNSQYIQQARQRGLEHASTRGGINSSIAAGASERAAIDAASGLAQQATGIDTARQMSNTQANMQNWVDQQGFNREFQGEMAMLPVRNAANMLSMVQQYAMQDPALYTPDVVSGYSNFFNENMKNLMRQFSGVGRGNT